jgi:Zn-dependent protease
MILNTLFSDPLIFLIWLVAILIPITVHEFAHGFTAYLLGDPTAKNMGRLTFNPIAHIDFIGFLLLLLVGFGWGKPVPYNPYNLKNKRWGPLMVSLSGPLSNLILIVIFGLLLKGLAFLGTENYLILLLVFLVQINIILMIFNLLPIPPLDGSSIVFSLLPARFDNFKMAFQRSGYMILLFLIIFDSLFKIGILSTIFGFFSNLIFKVIG